MNSMFSMSMKDVANAQLDLSAFDTQSLQDASRMFFSSGVKTIYVSSNFQTNTIINSSMMFDGSTNLVGGNGTTYSSSNPTDKTYARIDARAPQAISLKSHNPSRFAWDFFHSLL